jgi:hypothetical protein
MVSRDAHFNDIILALTIHTGEDVARNKENEERPSILSVLDDVVEATCSETYIILFYMHIIYF